MNILIKNTQIVKSGADDVITGSIAIKDGIIEYVGDVADFKADTVIDGSNFAALPGLVNAHTHSPMGILRNLADDLPFDEWLFNNIIPAESKLTEEDIYLGAKLGILEMIKSGVTCFADMYLKMDAIGAAVAESRIRANLSYGPITSAVRGDGLIVDTDSCEKFIKKWNNMGAGLIKAFIEIHSVYLFDEPSIREAAALAKKLNTGIHIHLCESDEELRMSDEKYGMSPIEAADSLGIFENPVIAAHCVKLSDNDIKLLKEHLVSPVHNISSNLKLGNGVAPVKRLLSEGINVCLGTDGAASNNNLNIIEEMHLTALVHKGVNSDPECLDAGTVIDMATANGYKALGFSGLGRIEKGDIADIILIDLNKPHILPVNNVKSAIVYSAQAGDVDTVIVNGEVLMRGREVMVIDEEAVLAGW